MARRPLWIGWGLFLSLGAISGLALEGVKAQVERGLTQFLQTPISIRRLTLTPWKMTLHEVAFQADPESGGALLSVDRLQIAGPPEDRSVTVTGLTLSFAGVPLRGEGHLFLTAAAAGSVAQCEGRLTFEHPFFRGEVEASGKASEPVLLGWLQGMDGLRRHFVGQLTFTEEGVRLSQMEIQGGWTARGAIQRKGSLRSFLRWEGPEGRFELRVEPSSEGADGSSDGGGRAVLWIHEQDQVPQEIAAKWVVRRSHLDLISSLEGGRISINGRIGLEPPYPLQLTLDLKEMEMADLVRRILRGRAGPAVTGPVEGRVSLSGPWDRLNSQGELVSSRGKVGQERFLLAAIRFSGVGPLLTIQNSHLTKSSGVMLLEGTVDLRRIGQPDFFKGVRISPIGRSLVFRDWQMSPTQGASGLEISRTGGKDHPTVSLAYEVDPEAPMESVTREKVGVRVPLSSREQVKMTIDEGGEFLGVEHREKF